MNKMSWIFIGIAAGACILIGLFLTRPNVVGAWQTYKKIQVAKAELAQVSAKKDALSTLNKNNQLTTIYDIAQKYIPETQDSSGLIISLSAMAKDSKLKVDALSFDAAKTAAAAPAAATTDTATTDASKTTTTTTPAATSTAAAAPNIQEVTFNMTISGTFPDFLNFLKNTETSSRLITFTKMSFSQTDTSFIAQLSGTSYWKKGNSLENTLDNIKVTQKTIEKFQNLKSYGTPINLPTESGFGTSNPFTTAK